MQCELCGRDCQSCREATVDGVPMMLCAQCFRHGEGGKPFEVPTPVKRYLKKKKVQPKSQDIFQKMEKELISNYHEIIRKAREKKGLSREDLGFKIGERTVTISKIENGDLRPSDKTITKLEKELEITLLEEVKSLKSGHSYQTEKMTLGDFIKND